jgi:Hemerythrin HHE cation binding domain
MNAVSKDLVAAVSDPEPGWLALTCQQHREIEQALDQLGRGVTVEECRRAERALRLAFAAHTSAEETVLYPALCLLERRHVASDHGREWMYIVELRHLFPLSARYQYVFQHLQASLLDHMNEEETIWLPPLQQRTQGKLQHRLAQAMRDHYDRYSRVAATLLTPYLLLMACANRLDDVMDFLSPCLECAV